MREFLFNSEELLDSSALDYLAQGEVTGILPCRIVKWNRVLQLVYFTDGFESARNLLMDMSADELREIGIDILEYVSLVENSEVLSPENIVLDADSIYLDGNNQAYVICLPAVLPPEIQESGIYIKRVYALLLEMFSSAEGTEDICKRIEMQQEKAEGDWQGLIDVLSRSEMPEDDSLMLKSVNTREPVTFIINKELFRIGSDPSQADGCIFGSSEVSPLHAIIGWNEINYYVQDLGSAGGTCVNDVRISPNVQIPVGRGNILRFADCTFSVE